MKSYKDKICITSCERTSSIYLECDVILFLPGGTGTFAEIFGMLEENRSINNPKEIILYNYNGFYDGVLDLIQFCVDNKFNTNDIFDYFCVCYSMEEIIEKIWKTWFIKEEYIIFDLITHKENKIRRKMLKVNVNSLGKCLEKN